MNTDTLPPLSSLHRGIHLRFQRDDYHATRDTVILFGLIAALGYGSYALWHSGRVFLTWA